MGFASGSVSCRRFAVVGNSPDAVDQNVLDKLAKHALRPAEIGSAEDVEFGWCGGRHVNDGQFTFEHNVYADALHFALRIDTNKVPSALVKSWQVAEEDAAAKGNPSGRISKEQKKQVKESVKRKTEEELKTGKYRRSKLVPVLWDLASQTLYSPASGSAAESLLDLFEQTFKLRLEPLSAGSEARRLLESKDRHEEFAALRPTRFATGPGGEGEEPEYPWTSSAPEPRDFLGNEFLLWLWHEADARTGAIDTNSKTVGEVTVFIDRSLDLDCAFGQTGRDSIRGDGPSRSPEARHALKSGKVPRKAGLCLHARGQQFDFDFNPETLAFGSAKLPDVEDAETPRAVFEERVGLLRDLCQAVDALYATFVLLRCGSDWDARAEEIREWASQPAGSGESQAAQAAAA